MNRLLSPLPGIFFFSLSLFSIYPWKPPVFFFPRTAPKNPAQNRSLYFDATFLVLDKKKLVSSSPSARFSPLNDLFCQDFFSHSTRYQFSCLTLIPFFFSILYKELSVFWTVSFLSPPPFFNFTFADTRLVSALGGSPFPSFPLLLFFPSTSFSEIFSSCVSPILPSSPRRAYFSQNLTLLACSIPLSWGFTRG